MLNGEIRRRKIHRTSISTTMMITIMLIVGCSIDGSSLHVNAYTLQHVSWNGKKQNLLFRGAQKQHLFLLSTNAIPDLTDTTSTNEKDIVMEQTILLSETILDDISALDEMQDQDSFMNPTALPVADLPSTTTMVQEQPDVATAPATNESTTISVTPSDVLQQQQTKNELNIWAARGLLLLVAAIWGTNFASVKYLENLCFHPPCHHPPSEAAFARFGLAALVSIPLLVNQKWDVIRAGLECGLWISLGYFTQALALSTIDAGQCAFICSLTVVFVPVAAAVLYNKPIRPSNFIAATIALAGVGVLEGMFNVNDLLGITPAIAASTSHAVSDMIVSSNEHLQTVGSGITEAVSTGPLVSFANSLGVNKGDILALGQPIGFGTAFLRIEQYQEQLKDVPNRILTIAAAQCVAVGIMAFFWVLYDFHGTIPNFGYMIEPHRIAAIGWTGIVTTVVAIFIEGIALQKASATDASLAFSTEPIWASLFGFILLHETLGINSYVGGALILAACLVGAIADLRLSQQQKTIIDDP